MAVLTQTGPQANEFLCGDLLPLTNEFINDNLLLTVNMVCMKRIDRIFCCKSCEISDESLLNEMSNVWAYEGLKLATDIT